MGILWKIVSAPICLVLYFTYIKSSFYSYVDTNYMKNSNKTVLLLEDCNYQKNNTVFYKLYKDKVAKALKKKGFLVFYNHAEAPVAIDLIAYFYVTNNTMEYIKYTNTVIPSIENNLGSAMLDTDISHSFDLTFYNPHNIQEMVMALHCDTKYATHYDYNDYFMYSFLIKESIARLEPYNSKRKNFTVVFPVGIDQSQYW